MNKPIFVSVKVPTETTYKSGPDALRCHVIDKLCQKLATQLIRSDWNPPDHISHFDMTVVYGLGVQLVPVPGKEDPRDGV